MGFHVGKYTIVLVDMGDGLGGGFKHYLEFSPRTVGKWSNLTSILQMGWNHQVDLGSGIAGVCRFL